MEEIILAPNTSPRKLAALAGKMVAVSPAVLPAALYSRGLFEAFLGKLSWDQVFPTTETVKETAIFWRDNIGQFNGRRWWPRNIGIQVEVD
jgi:hypothetical protein